MLRTLTPAGVRNYVTEAAGTAAFGLANNTDRDLEARVLTYFAKNSDRQYGRTIRVPAQSTVWSWFPFNAPDPKPDRNFVELKTMIYYRDGNEERLVLSPDEQPLHSVLTRFFPREAGTAIMLDADLEDGTRAVLTPEEQTMERDFRELARVFRSCLSLSDRINAIPMRFLPPAVEGFDGVDHIILASNRIADDAAGQEALRGWLARGGYLWLPLDVVEPRTISALLGDSIDLQVVDRLSLTDIPLRRGPANRSQQQEVDITVEEPIDFVRVLAPDQEILHTVNGWPASMIVEVGRGRVLFTMLGARGWYRPRASNDGPSPYKNFFNLSVAQEALLYLANEIRPLEKPSFSENEFYPFVNEQIGYAVVGRGVTMTVFGVFFLLLAAGAAILGWHARLEQLGWIGPAIALGVAGILLVLGDRARAVPRTVAAAQLVETTSGLPEAQVTGLLAVFNPAASTTPVGSSGGGQIDLDLSGLDGRALRRVQSDLNDWHWENLELPAGVRAGPFRYSLRTEAPLSSVIRFGPEGIEGRVTTGGLPHLEDAVLSTSAYLKMGVRMRPDGAFQASSSDTFAPGQYVSGTLLSQKQRDRQQFYSKILAAPLPRSIANRRLLLGWSDVLPLPFTLTQSPQQMGAALTALPLQFERTLPDTAVTIPGPFMEFVRQSDTGTRLRMANESAQPANLRLRFQVPGSVLPLRIEWARLTLKLSAPSRPVVIAGYEEAKIVPVRQLESPIGVETVEIANPRLLKVDNLGGLFLNVDIGDAPPMMGPDDKPVRVTWNLEFVDLEVRGRTLAPN